MVGPENAKTSHARHSITGLSLAALGVVFGDIGTSPLYAIRECFYGEYGIAVTRDNIFGILSLMFWTLIIIVSIKYLSFIFRADNRGEGGIIALTALIKSITVSPTRRRLFLISMGIFGACLLYGDGMITPAISVLSAAEGLRIIAPELQKFVIPLTLVILAALFMLQHRGTARIGILFGPVILVWFVILAILGLWQIIHYPGILAALLPTYGIKFLVESGIHGFTVLGAVFLVVTGAEALYADLGHFGRRPIRLVWFYLVLPSLLLNYLGQGALLLSHPSEAHHPFYAMVPDWAVVPMVILATCATIIASQAVITGVFSLTRQAIQMGYLPRLKVVHTSSRHFGQIYVPLVNWLLMFATLGLVIGFQSSSKLAAAYGVAVTLTMLISTVLFYVVARTKWNWSRLAAGIPVAVFLVTDLSFFSANLSKIMHGAWFPLVLGGTVMLVMTTWKRGREILAEELRHLTVPFVDFKKKMAEKKISRVKGYAVFLTGQPRTLPIAIIHNLEHNKTVHSNVLLLNFSFLEVPRVPNKDKLHIEDLGSGFHQLTATYGFMESPNVPSVLALALGQGLEVPIDQTSYFLGREKLVVNSNRPMSRWRAHLFAFLSRNAYDASTFFEIPEDRVIEVGIRLTI
ncbi:MAG: potassium transporter Kup [candidate division Zixibacteria bacterium]|nr:potassium transporter Kup [candidate division Zixibacteria bacterium]